MNIVARAACFPSVFSLRISLGLRLKSKSSPTSKAKSLYPSVSTKGEITGESWNFPTERWANSPLLIFLFNQSFKLILFDKISEISSPMLKIISVTVSSALSLVTLSVQATDYEKIDLSSSSGETKVLNGVCVDSSTSLIPAVRVSGSQNYLQGKDYEINARTNGVLVEDGGKAELSDVIIDAGNTGALSVGVGSRLVLDNARITTRNDRSVGIRTQNGSLIFLNGTINAKEDGISINGTYPMSSGAVVRNSEVTSQNGNGITVNANKVNVDLDTVRVNTLGTFGSAAIYMSVNDAKVNVKNSLLFTGGQQAEAVRIQGGEFNMYGGGLLTQGISAHALSASSYIASR